VVNGRVISVSPHSFYVETYFRTGVLGLILVAGLYVLAMRRLSRTGGGGCLSPRVLFLLLAAQPVYFVSYTPAQEQNIVVGLSMGVAVMLSQATGTKGHATATVQEP
jgi:O-antigen ligase